MYKRQRHRSVYHPPGYPVWSHLHGPLAGARAGEEVDAPAAVSYTHLADAIRPAIERQIQGTLEQSLQVEDSLASTGGEAPALEELPISEVLEALQESALYRGLAQAFQEAVDNGVAQVTTSAAKALAEYAAVQLARMVLFLLAFVAVLIAWFLLSHALDLAFRLPVLSALNHWSGAALGLLKGGALIFIACWLLRNSLIPPEAIQNTYLLNFFCTFDPLSLLP